MPYRNAIIAAQLISLCTTATIVLGRFGTQMLPDQLESAGGSLSSALIVLGIVLHIQAKRSKPHLGLLVLLAGFGPVYAYIGGHGRYLAGFHLAALGFHGIVLKVLAGKAQKPEQAED